MHALAAHVQQMEAGTFGTQRRCRRRRGERALEDGDRTRLPEAGRGGETRRSSARIRYVCVRRCHGRTRGWNDMEVTGMCMAEVDEGARVAEVDADGEDGGDDARLYEEDGDGR